MGLFDKIKKEVSADVDIAEELIDIISQLQVNIPETSCIPGIEVFSSSEELLNSNELMNNQNPEELLNNLSTTANKSVYNEVQNVAQ